MEQARVASMTLEDQYFSMFREMLRAGFCLHGVQIPFDIRTQQHGDVLDSEIRLCQSVARGAMTRVTAYRGGVARSAPANRPV